MRAAIADPRPGPDALHRGADDRSRGNQLRRQRDRAGDMRVPEMAEVIRIGAIADDRMLLDGLRSWLRQIDDLRVVHVATSTAAFLAAATDVQVVLLDLNLRDHRVPADNVARLRAAGFRILMISAIPDPEHVLATVEAGPARDTTPAPAPAP